MACKGCQSYANGGPVCDMHEGSPADAAMRKRKMAKGGAVEPVLEAIEDFDSDLDSDFDLPEAEDDGDDSLAGQAMKKRKLHMAKGGEVPGVCKNKSCSNYGSSHKNCQCG